MYKLLFFITEHKYKLIVGVLILILGFLYFIINNSKLNIETNIDDDIVSINGEIISYFGIKDYKITLKEINGVKLHTENSEIENIDINSHFPYNILQSSCFIDDKRCSINISIDIMDLIDSYYKSIYLKDEIELLKYVTSSYEKMQELGCENFCNCFEDSLLCNDYDFSFENIVLNINYNTELDQSKNKIILITNN